MQRKKVFIKLILLLMIPFILLACSKDTVVQTTAEINPLNQTNITQMIIERSDKKIVTVKDPKVIDTAIQKLSNIKVEKLNPEQEESFLDNKERHAAGYTYNLIFKDEAKEIKSYAVLLFNRDNKALMLVDVKTIKSNNSPASYANIDDQETLDYINEIYSIATAEMYKDFLNKAKEKGINEIMLTTLGNLGYGEEEILNLSSDELARIFAPETPLDGEIINEAIASSYNPPKIEGLLQAIKNSEISADGDVLITSEIKREFNQMGEDYLFFFMPRVSWYDFRPIVYEGTGKALHYILFMWTGEFGAFPEKAPKYEAEARLRKIFAAPDNEYPLLEHKDYRKCVMFDGEAYTLWPESYNANKMIYELTDLKVRENGGYTYYTAFCNEYQFDLTGAFEPGENEKFLQAQGEILGMDKLMTLSKLLETGKISAAPDTRAYTIEFRIEGDNTTPQIVSVDMGV